MSDALAPRRFVCLFLGVAVCAMLSACSTTPAAGSKVVKTPGDLFDDWETAASNPLVNPKPDFEQTVLIPLKKANCYQCFGAVLGMLNSTSLNTISRQVLVLKYEMALASTAEQKDDCYRGLQMFASDGTPAFRTLLEEFKKQNPGIK